MKSGFSEAASALIFSNTPAGAVSPPATTRKVRVSREGMVWKW
jgi:hypothetical protein